MEETLEAPELEAEDLPFEAPGEPAEPSEGDDEPSEPGEDDGDDEAPDENEEGESVAEDEPHGLSEKALAARHDKLDRENERHAKRVGEILEDDAGDVIPCPVCMDGIAGWIYPPDQAPLPDEAIARIRQVIGLPDLTTLRDDPGTMPCPVCDGLGETRTGSHVPGYEKRTCPRCAKQGYVVIGQAMTLAADNLEPGDVVTGPTVYSPGDDDPEVRHLRERGFTVIPPIPIAG